MPHLRRPAVAVAGGTAAGIRLSAGGDDDAAGGERPIGGDQSKTEIGRRMVF